MTNPLDERLVKIETALTHLDHRCEQLHEAILSQQRQIESLRHFVEQVQTALDRDLGLVPEARDPADEKPPHY